MGATINRAARFHSVTENPAAAMCAFRGQGMNCALEAVEDMLGAVLRDPHHFIVIVSARIAFCHGANSSVLLRDSGDWRFEKTSSVEWQLSQPASVVARISGRRRASHRSGARPSWSPISSHHFGRPPCFRRSEYFRLNARGGIARAVSVADASFFVLPYRVIAPGRFRARTKFWVERRVSSPADFSFRASDTR